ncbi:hypothetical protein ITP53_36995 [Nonomuraea sp. K274]|uniref:Uncharacterized protein n=1 Tax=Nonomuraea cypriaca TaxID=1187855 RepID=A0A931F324_9ACTN|nr:hypothetical protein [Nonomuraea cypriaca]MBF8191212.1 hypothetical protein [Nonomuraea cypriaca]
MRSLIVGRATDIPRSRHSGNPAAHPAADVQDFTVEGTLGTPMEVAARVIGGWPDQAPPAGNPALLSP